MKKTVKKLALIAMSAVTAVAMCFAMVACGETKEPAKVTNVYISEPGSAGTAEYRKQPMGMVVCNTETITLYDDNTYVLNVTTTVITNMTAITEGNDQVINRGVTELEYYGSYATEVDSGITTLKLVKPTRLTINNTNTLLTGGVPVGFYDTAAWTDAYTEAHASWWGSFGTKDVQPTGENVLAKFAFDDKEVLISETGTFDYIKCSYHNVTMGF